jgi:hypothetical protein
MAYYILPDWFFNVDGGARETMRLCGREMGFCRNCKGFPDYGHGNRCVFTGRTIERPRSQYCDEWEHNGED